jgi:hypothetical protein
MTHGYKRPGTTTLFAALNVLDRSMIGRCMQGHSHQEFISLLNAVERQAPAGESSRRRRISYVTHRRPKVRAWLASHPLEPSTSRPPMPRGSTPSRASSRR